MKMVKIKDMQTISTNYTGSAARAGTDYAKGVVGVDWATPASSSTAESNYGTAVQEAVAAGRRAKMIQAAGNQKWLDGASKLGAQRIVTGIQNAGPAQSKGYAPYHDLIAGLTLPAKSLDYNSNIQNRLLPVVAGQVALKKQIKG